MSHFDFDRLAFHDLLKRMAAGTYSPRGRNLLENSTPVPDLESLQQRREIFSEVVKSLDGDRRPPFGNIPELDSILTALTKPGAVIPGELLWDLSVGIEVLEASGKFFADHGQDLFPSFAELHGLPSRYSKEHKELLKALEPGGLIRDDATTTLSGLRKRIRRQEEKVRRMARSTAATWFREGWAQEQEPVLREGRQVIAVRAEARNRVNGVALDRSRSGQTVFIEPQEISEVRLELKQIKRDEEHEVEIILSTLSSLCATRAADLDADLDRFALLDAAQATARYSEAGPLMLPEIGHGGSLELYNARHPVLASTHGLDVVVPLTLSLEQGSRTLVISGPNSGGKTVALQTTGLCTALAICGLPIPAGEESRIPFINQIHVDIGDEQSIEADLSTFTAKLMRLRAMLEPVEAGKLCMIDEAGAGTDPGQGAALSISILEHLTGEGAFVLCATHNGRIKTHAAQAQGMANGRMIFSEKALTPTYEFRAGEQGRSFAFEIAERSGMPPGLVARAREILGTVEINLENALMQASMLREEAERLLRQAEIDSRNAVSERRKYESLSRELETNADRKRKDAAEEARVIVRESRRRIEGIFREIKESNASPAAIKKAQKTLRELIREVDEQAGKASVRDTVPDIPLKEGDEVYLSSLERPAVVQRIGPRRIRVRAGSLSLEVSRSDLVMIAEDSRGVPMGGDVGTGLRQKEAGGVRTPLKSVPLVLDIIGQRAEEARQSIEKYLDDAIVAELEDVTIIHGSGGGVLRRIVEEVLKNHISVEECGLDVGAPGGTGITRARLKGSVL